MTDNTQSFSRKGYLKKSFIDAVTCAGGVALIVASTDYGSVATGVATGVLFPVLAYSSMGLITRLLFDSPNAREIADHTGLGLMGSALKNCVSDAKIAAMLIGMMTAIGFGTGLTVESFRHGRIQREAARAEWNKRPVLPLDTIIEKREIKAGDHCVDARGYKLPSGREVGVTYKDAKYRIVCP